MPLANINLMGGDALAGAAMNALKSGDLPEAVACSLSFAAKSGPYNPEAHLLCAAILEKAGFLKASLEHWDKAINHSPHRLDWLEAALSCAWRAQKTLAEAAAYAENWQDALVNVFISTPSFAILRALRARGWSGKGCLGIHEGRLRGWLFAAPGEKFIFSEKRGRGGFSIHLVSRGADQEAVLYEINEELPQGSQVDLSITDSNGAHVKGSPLLAQACDFPKARDAMAPPARGIGVIIPVFADRKATLRCLGSLFASLRFCKSRAIIITVWDHGPDKRLERDLRRLAAEGRTVFLETPRNLGFLGAVNHALAHLKKCDVVLLNSDTLVHGDWLDRLAAAGSMPGTGTVTPLGSDAELLSFPSFIRRASIMDLKSAALLDEACASLPANEAIFEIPVGVGFCMFISRHCLARIGGLDGRMLFRGYGEEVDFCLRAAEAGFKNLAAANVFVAHLCGRSFGKSKKTLASQNNQAIFARFPDYRDDYDRFLLEDPLKPAREKISLALAAGFSDAGLHVLPMSAMHLPAWENGDENERNGADCSHSFALFLMPGRALLRHFGPLELEDMTFLLPERASALEKYLEPFKNVHIHGANPLLHALSEELGLKPERWPETGQAPEPPPDLDFTKGNFLLAPPADMDDWHRLFSFARKRPGAAFYVPALKKIWTGAHLPANLLNAPGQSLEPLEPQALCFFGETDDICAWRHWLEKRSCPKTPIYSIIET